MKTLVEIKISCLDTERIITIKSGDNKAWNKLSRCDQSMIQEVCKHAQVVICGKTIYEPVYK